MNEFEKTNQQDVSKGNKRRSFLKKSATGAVVFSLPAKSVWGGCSVSGSMSGNLSAVAGGQTCIMPEIEGGASPDIWKNAESNINDLFSNLKDQIGQPGYDELKDLYLDAVNVQKNASLGLPSELTNTTSPTVGDALSSGDLLHENLATVYLNATFGLYLGYNGEMSAIELVNFVFLYIYTNDKAGTPVSPSYAEYGFSSTGFNSSTLQLP